jgi:NAD(P)H-hydrate epimerase
MGDVLAGIIGALLGRGLEPVEAATAGVLWHARAGDLVAARRSQASLTAMDVVGALADVERTPC